MHGARPDGARLTLFPNFKRNLTEHAIAATEKYVNLARVHDLDPAQMAIAFVNSRRFLTSNIIGATTLEQLESNIAADDLVLSDTVLQEIDKIHAEYPNPAP
jgi:aryl-alcohol dehydrogenase-like predicted oxidoreductase